jgi:hypothetical protein
VAACKSDILLKLLFKFQEWDKGRNSSSAGVDEGFAKALGVGEFTLEYFDDLYYIPMFETDSPMSQSLLRL